MADESTPTVKPTRPNCGRQILKYALAIFHSTTLTATLLANAIVSADPDHAPTTFRFSDAIDECKDDQPTPPMHWSIPSGRLVMKNLTRDTPSPSSRAALNLGYAPDFGWSYSD